MKMRLVDLLGNRHADVAANLGIAEHVARGPKMRERLLGLRFSVFCPVPGLYPADYVRGDVTFHYLRPEVPA
eukprot:6376143-Amphidinium_carterae.1